MFRVFEIVIGFAVVLNAQSTVVGQVTSPTHDRNDRVQARLDRLEAELNALKLATGLESPRSRPFGHSEPDELSSVVAAAHSTADTGRFHMTQPEKWFSGSGFPTVRLNGFFQADAGWIHQDAANKLAVDDVQDGAGFRRARLMAIGNVWDNVGYMMEFDFAFPGRPSFMDVWLEVHDLEFLGNLRVGQFRHPIGMEGLTSVKELTFLERGLPFAFLPFRQIGLMAHDVAEDESATWSVSAFRFPTDVFGGNVGDSGGYAMATRLTWLPVDEGDSGPSVHLGAAYSFGDPANNRIRYRNQPEFFVSETGGVDLVPIGVPTNVPVFVDTGPIAANNFNLFGVEAATSVGSFHFQSELIYALVNQIGGPTVAFSGAYLQAGYILTGEKKPYDHKIGVLGRVVPDKPFSRHFGHGAWEVAVRWSYLDLNDKNIRGGRLNDLTSGINWYLNRYTKIQLNYIHAFLDTPGIGDSNADIVAVRAHVDF